MMPAVEAGSSRSAATRPDRAPARFWHRYAAWSLDFAFIAAIAWFATRAQVVDGLAAAGDAWRRLSDLAGSAMVNDMLDGRSLPSIADALLQAPSVRAAAQALQDGLERATLPFALACAGIALLWHALGEASRWQGSPGKRAFGLVVADLEGEPPGFARALARQVGGVASWITLNLGHLLAALPPQFRALHDYLAGTRVLRNDDAAPRMPLAAKLWLWLQVLGGLVALAWAVSRYFALLASVG
jgi:uncharacterized RDD family membrane protein YckC